MTTVTKKFHTAIICRWIILSSVLLITTPLSILHAATYTVISSANWSAFPTTPTTSDNIVVRNGATLTVDVSDAVCASIQLGRDGMGAGFAGTGTLVFNASSQLTVSGTVTIGAPTANNRSGTITMTAGGSLICDELVLSAGGNNIVNTITQGMGSSISVTGSTTLHQPIQNTTVYNWNVNEGVATLTGLLTFAGTNTTATRMTQINITTGTLNANGGISFDVVGNAFTKRIEFSGIGGTLNVGGAGMLNSDNAAFAASISTVNYNAAGAQTIAPFAYHNITLSGSGDKTFTTGTTLDGTLSMQGTAALVGTAPSFMGAASVLEYAGSALQFTTDLDFPSTNGPSSLTINNMNGVELHDARSIDITLTLTAGHLTTTVLKLLTLSSTATVSGASKDSFIDGPLAKVGNSAFEFPTGDMGIYAPIAISAPSVATDVFTAQYIRSTPTDVGDIKAGSGIDHVSTIEHWELDRTGSSDVTVTLSWRANSDVTDPPSIVVARYDGDEWDNEGNDGTTGNAAGGTVTSDMVTSFSPFTLASTLGGPFNPLPVELLSFTAKKRSKGVLLEWETATETNNAFFQVERSLNGKAFDAISKVEGVGNSDITQSYQWLDENPRSGINYYRLKQVDFDGAFEYHPIVSVDMGPIKEASLQLFPNPSIDKVNILLPSTVEGEADILLYNAVGQLVKTTSIDLVQGNNNTELDIRKLPKGRYTMLVHYGGQRLTQAPLIIQQ